MNDTEAIAAYVAGRLEGAALEDFERRLLVDPALVRELDNFAALQGALRELAVQGELVPRPRWLRWQRHAALAIAAAVLLAIGAGLWFRQPMGGSLLYRDRAALPAGHSREVAASLTLVALRGSTTPVVPVVTAGLIEIAVRPPLDEAAVTVTLGLVRKDGGRHELLGRLTSVPLATDGYAHAFIDAPALQPGRYEVTLTITGSGAPPAEGFAFEVAPP